MTNLPSPTFFFFLFFCTSIMSHAPGRPHKCHREQMRRIESLLEASRMNISVPEIMEQLGPCNFSPRTLRRIKKTMVDKKYREIRATMWRAVNYVAWQNKINK
jgi:hypothetical protein